MNESTVTTVHPRAGGEHDIACQVQCRAHRFIPAQAGNTKWNAESCSSPRSGACVRFIPAQAGNTSPHQRTRGPSPPVHPRAGGEHIRPGDPVGAPRRFIPAQAGNTGQFASERPLFAGSSPRRRGTLVDRGGGRLRLGPDRFIPAQAGNTPAAAGFGAASHAPSTVHPRAGGEHRRRAGSCAISWTGSSPRRRGTRRSAAASRFVTGTSHRFIPAQAGNTCPSSEHQPSVSPTVHPRAGGEHIT